MTETEAHRFTQSEVFGARSAHAQIYANAGNRMAAQLMPPSAITILDVGCGAGDNARLLRTQNTARQITGITLNRAEAELAAADCAAVHVADATSVNLDSLGGPFDAILFSHVLEHVSEPTAVLERFLGCLNPKGSVIIIVPNVLQWRIRLQLMLGHFDCPDHGVLDRTHLRFFTPRTVVRELISPVHQLRLDQIVLNGSVPLAFLRRSLLSNEVRSHLDRFGARMAPANRYVASDG